MNFIKHNVHDPRKEERGPSDDDHRADLAGGHHVGVPIDVNQLHFIRNIDHCRDGQPSRIKIALKYRTMTVYAFIGKYLPSIKRGHHEEIDQLLDKC